MLRLLVLVCFASIARVRGAVGAAKGPSCRIIATPVSATAENLVIPEDLNILSLTHDEFVNLTSTLPTTQISGTYRMVGRYCAPEVDVAARRNTIQFLLHGATYTKDYWSGLGPPGHGFNGTAYSWVNYASKLGYPTFALDRICNGESTHADALAVCQYPMNAAIHNNMIGLLRGGKLVEGHEFSKVVVVGHSAGSLSTNVMNQNYPDIADAVVLTGFTDRVATSVVGDLAAGRFQSVAVSDPKFFAKYLDPNYFRVTHEPGLTGVFYYGDFTNGTANFDYNHRGEIPAGEFVSIPLAQLPAAGFEKPIFVVNGAQDQVFCAKTVSGPTNGYEGDCGTGPGSFTARTLTLYPNAQPYAWHQINQTGHDINLHYTSQELFKIAHDFLAAHGF